MDSERRSQRYPSHRPLQLRCETWNEFVDTYASDVSRGGMFICTDEAPEVLSTIELRLLLPDGAAVSLAARVVHVVTTAQAELHGRNAGIGVELVHVDAEQRRQVLQLVEFARSQCAEDADPNASFARTLLETSTSIPAGEVGAHLSALPDAALGGDPNASASAALRAAKASRVNLPAVQAPGDEPANSNASYAVRPPPRPPSAQLDPNLLPAGASRPIVRTPTGPIGSGTARSSMNIPITRTPTGPIGSGTARSSTNIPITRTPTGPLGSGTARSSTSMPAVRTHSGSLAGASSRSSTNNPIVRTPTGPIAPSAGSADGTPGAASDLPGRATSGPISASPGTASANPAAASGQPQVPPQPTDLNRLKLVLNALAHKHYDDGARMAREMLAENPGDPQVLKWQAVCFARMALARNDAATAVSEYEKVLRYDDGNREARDFIRNYQRDRKLSALPFGRYFTKKK